MLQYLHIIFLRLTDEQAPEGQGLHKQQVDEVQQDDNGGKPEEAVLQALDGKVVQLAPVSSNLHRRKGSMTRQRAA